MIEKSVIVSLERAHAELYIFCVVVWECRARVYKLNDNKNIFWIKEKSFYIASVLDQKFQGILNIQTGFSVLKKRYKKINSAKSILFDVILFW